MKINVFNPLFGIRKANNINGGDNMYNNKNDKNLPISLLLFLKILPKKYPMQIVK